MNKINKDISKSLDKSSSSSSKNSNESQSPSPNKLKDMMEALSNSEALCDELEKRQENKDLLQQYEINKNTRHSEVTHRTDECRASVKGHNLTVQHFRIPSWDPG